MPKFFRHYGIQPGIRSKFDDLVILEWGQLFDHAGWQWFENHADEVLDAEQIRDFSNARMKAALP